MDRAKSRRVEHQERSIASSKQNIVRVFVLNDDINGLNPWLLPERPAEHMIERWQVGRFVPYAIGLAHDADITAARDRPSSPVETAVFCRARAWHYDVGVWLGRLSESRLAGRLGF